MKIKTTKNGSSGARMGRLPSPLPLAAPAGTISKDRGIAIKRRAMRTLLEKSGVAGWEHHAGDLALARGMASGETLVLVRDPENEYDANAIKVLYPSEGKDIPIGFIAKAAGNGAIALLMDLGHEITAKVCAIDATSKNPWKKCTLNVFATGKIL